MRGDRVNDMLEAAAPRLRVAEVHKSFGETVALADVGLTVARGEVHAVVGENGAGKSTLMKVISGAIPPAAGRMWLDGASYRPRSPAEGRRAGVAMIYQELSLAPHLSVAENIMLGVEPAAGPFLRRGELQRRATAALREVGHAEIPAERRVADLSAAQRQIVEIARSQALGARLLVLDEPTSSLGAADVQRLFSLIRRLAAAGCSILYISHALEEVLEISDRITVMRDGRVVETLLTAAATPAKLARLMVGRELDEIYPRSPRACGEPLLELRDLAGAGLPRSATLTVCRGEVVGIAGLLGAGRTELLRAIFGLAPVRGGKIRVAARGGTADPPRRWAQGVGMLSEDRAGEGLALRLDVEQNVMLPGLRRLGALGLLAPGRLRRRAAARAAELSIRCAGVNQPVAALSGGNQQKVALARLLDADADLLLLDEPTRGVDVGAKAQIYRLIDALATGTGGARPRAVLMVSSYLPELLGVCDRIAVMRRGRLGEARHVAEWTEHTLMLAATGAAE